MLGDRDTIPDLDVLAAGIEDAFAELRKAADDVTEDDYDVLDTPEEPDARPQ